MGNATPSAEAAGNGCESVVGVIPNASLRMGLFRRPTFTLVVTPGRIIAARITSEMLRQEAKQANEQVKASGKGLGRRFLATLGAGATFHERYLSMDPDQALREHESNFAISTSEVKSVKARWHQMDEDNRQRQDDLILKMTGGNKYHFKTSPNASAQASEVLRSVLGDRVK